MEWDKGRIPAYLASSSGIYHSLRKALGLVHIVPCVTSQTESQDPPPALLLLYIDMKRQAFLPQLLWTNTENQGN